MWRWSFGTPNGLKEAQAEEMWARLRNLGMGAVISDTAGRRDALHAGDSPFVLVRFGGYEGHASDELRLAQWAKRIAEWKDQGLSEFHLLVHQPDSIHTPETCRQFARLVKEQAGIEVLAPTDLRAATRATYFHERKARGPGGHVL